jgi:nicotinamide mononucleotide transporter
MNIFDINYIVFTAAGYPVSFIELAGTISGFACVYLTAKERVICWPVGIVNIVFFFFMFYQVRLYSDMLLQVYFLVTTIYGWWRWTHPNSDSERDGKDELRVTDLTAGQFAFLIALCSASTFLLGALMSDIHTLLPSIFREPAAYPYADAFTTVFSVAAQIIMAMKKRQCWLLWITVDIAAAAVYFLKGINRVAIEYILFGIIAAAGFINWTGIRNSYSGTAEAAA